MNSQAKKILLQGHVMLPIVDPLLLHYPIQLESFSISDEKFDVIFCECVCSIAQSCPTLYAPIFALPWIVELQASLSFTISWSLLKLISIESVMPPNHPILCRPLFLLPSIFPSTRVFSNELALCIRWPMDTWFCEYHIHSLKVILWFPLFLLLYSASYWSKIWVWEHFIWYWYIDIYIYIDTLVYQSTWLSVGPLTWKTHF